jgi:CheY-like chemotaxis protein
MSRDGDYDLFIVDVRMPLMLGTELAEEIRIDKPAAKMETVKKLLANNRKSTRIRDFLRSSRRSKMTQS